MVKVIDPIAMLQEQIDKSSLRKVAIQMKVSSAYLSDVMRGNRMPGPKVLQHLGLERVITKQVRYVRAKQ